MASKSDTGPISFLARLAILPGLLLVATHPAFGGWVGSARTGLWNNPATWSQGRVPSPGDSVFIAKGHSVVFTDPPDSEDECARVVIFKGGRLTFGGSATDFHVGGNGAGVVGGILVLGDLTIPGGVTVSIDPDGNAAAQQDGVTVYLGGSLNLRGRVLYEGTVGDVASDDNASDIVFQDSNLPAGLNPARARLVWRSGARKGRWYDIRSFTGTVVTLDYASRSNSERTGEPDSGTGAASVSGKVVTGTGTSWTEALALGSWWWCDSDGPAARVRVRRVDSPTTLQLDQPYGGSGCASAGSYILRDENQPSPAVDVSEGILPGDTYRVILPATLQSRDGSDLTYDEQTFVKILDGASFSFQNASFQSVGKEAWAAGEGSGVTIIGFDGRIDPGGVLDTVEIYRYGGDAGLQFENSTDFDVDWLFLHWAHPRITTSNEGHGLKFIHKNPSFVFNNVRVRNARFDRTNDDFVWWATSVGGTSGVTDSIGKYCPNTASGDSCDAIDTLDQLGITGGQLAIERNLFTNIGAQNGGSCLQVAVGSNTVQPAWRGRGWVARDNVCLNLQTVPCLTTVGQGLTWSRENIWAVNNVCASLAQAGIYGIPNVYQNEVLDYGLRRVSVQDGLRGPYQAKGNIFRGIPRQAGDTFTGNGVSIGFNLAGEANWKGASWTVSDNVIMTSDACVTIYSWSSPQFPAQGCPEVRHNVLVAHPLNDPSVSTFGILDAHGAPAEYPVAVTDNIFDRFFHSQSKAGIGIEQAYRDLIDSNVVRVTALPPWTGVLVSTRDYLVTTGIDPLASDFELKPGSGAWTVPTTDGDRQGPRFAGILASRLPFQVPGLVPNVDPQEDDLDSDGDGLIDRWDNCPFHPNPGWLDSDHDGTGDTCERCLSGTCPEPGEHGP